MKPALLIALLSTSFYAYQPLAIESYNLDELFNMSLEELLNIEIATGGLTGSTSLESASAITIINQDQIEMSTARNITGLLE